MTVNELALQCLKENDDATDDSNKVAIVEAWVNEGIAEIGDLTEWRFFEKEYTFSTAVSTSTYNLPAEALDLKYLQHTNDFLPIDYIDPEKLVLTGTDLNQSSRPEFFWYVGSSLGVGGGGTEIQLVIRLWPVPDAIYPLTSAYYFHPGILDSTDVLPVTRDKINVIKNYVRARLLFAEKEYEGYQLIMQEVNSKLTQAVSTERKKHARLQQLQTSDIPSSGPRRLARFNPAHYRN